MSVRLDWYVSLHIRHGLTGFLTYFTSAGPDTTLAKDTMHLRRMHGVITIMVIQQNASIIEWPLSNASVAAHARNMQNGVLLHEK